MMTPELVTAAAATPVSLAEIKAHARVDHAYEDDILSALIETATAHFDGRDGVLGRALITQTWRSYATSFCGRLRAPLEPVQALASVEYIDPDGVVQTGLDASSFEIYRDARGAYAIAPDNPPSVKCRPGAIRLTWALGYGAEGAVPQPIRTAIKLLAAHWYANREAAAVAQLSAIPFGIDRLVAPYKRRRL